MLPEDIFPEKSARTNNPEELRELLATNSRVTYATTDLASIEITPDGMVRWNGECLPFTRLFLESSAVLIGMPLAYAAKIDFGLFKHNFDQRKEKECCGIKLCLSRGAAINMCRAAYYPARTLDVLDEAERQIAGKKFHEGVVTDRGVELSWVTEQTPLNPRPGDTILHGLRISNSETGGRSLKASLYTLKLACKNGAVLSDEWGSARWTYDPRVTYKANLAHFFQDLGHIDAKVPKLADVCQRLTNEPLTDVDSVNLWRRVRAVVGPQAADDIFYTEPKERKRLFNQVRARRDPLAAVPTSFNGYEIHNRITAAAKEYDFLQWRRLEQIGGSMLRLPTEN